MSKWNRPMRLYHPIVLKCSVCAKPVTAAVFVNGAYQHNYNCLAPKGRPSRVEEPPDYEDLPATGAPVPQISSSSIDTRVTEVTPRPATGEH